MFIEACSACYRFPDFTMDKDLFSQFSVNEKLQFLFNNETWSDVHFIVEDTRIPAHKFILSIGSSVFDAMFNGSLPEKSGDIVITDIPAAAFLALLRYLYSDIVCVNSETVMFTLYAAKKYAVLGLQTECSEFLRTNLSSYNAFSLLMQAQLFDECELKAECLNFICKRSNSFYDDPDFVNIDRELLSCIIGRDTLEMKETEIFHSAMKWSIAECNRRDLPVSNDNQRAVLGPVLKLIRFPLMTMDDFSKNVVGSGLLTDREIISLFQYIGTTEKPSVEFSCKHRISTA